MITLLDEQQRVVDSALQGNSIKVTAHAGSGKTTTSLFLCKQTFEASGKKSLILSYNKSLQVDTEKRVWAHGLQAFCTIKTIHSAAGFFADAQIIANNEEKLQQVLEVDNWRRVVDFDIVIIDEAQDLNPLLFDAVCRIINHCDLCKDLAKNQQHPVQVILMGDVFQNINGFRGATAEYLLCPEEYLNPKLVKKRKFDELTLEVNNRSRPEICDYVNQVPHQKLEESRLYCDWRKKRKREYDMAWGNGIQSNPSLPQNSFNLGTFEVVQEFCMYSTAAMGPPVFIDTLYESIGERIMCIRCKFPGEVTVLLAPNFVSNSPYGKLLNWLSKTFSVFLVRENKELPCETVQKLSQDKLLVNTIHGAKGLGYPHAIVLLPGQFNERRWITDQKKNGPIEMGMYDGSDAFNLRHEALTRAQLSLTVCYLEKPLSFLADYWDDAVLTAPRKKNWTLKQLSRCGIDLSCVCTEEVVVDLQTSLFVSDDQCFAECRGGYSENYKPVVGSEVEIALACSLDMCNLKTVTQDIAKYYMFKTTWCACKDSHCPQDGCALNFHTFLNLSDARESLTGVNDPLFHQLALEFALYYFCKDQKYVLRQMHLGLHPFYRDHCAELEQCRMQGLELLSVVQQLHGTNVQYHKKVQMYTKEGEIDFLVGDAVVECKVTKALREEHKVQALLYSAMNNTFGAPCYMLSPNLGLLVRLTPRPGWTGDLFWEEAVRCAGLNAEELYEEEEDEYEDL